MIWNKVELIEPECRNLSEDLSLTRDCVWENAVESGDAVRCDDEEIFAELKNLAHFAAAEFRNTRRSQADPRCSQSMRDSITAKSEFSHRSGGVRASILHQGFTFRRRRFVSVRRRFCSTSLVLVTRERRACCRRCLEMAARRAWRSRPARLRAR